MPFPIENNNLYDYDIFPKVVCAGKPVQITIRPLGGRLQFVPGKEYRAVIKAISGGMPAYHPASASYEELTLSCGAEGGFVFTHTFAREQEYFIDIECLDRKGNPAKERFCVYCVEGDLAGKYPFIGDLHIHTTCSDGSQEPEVVCANYRKQGYDFIAVTDHRRYYPSLRAERKISALPTELNVLHGEEVHLPKAHGKFIDPHIVSIGARYSVNALIPRDDTEDFTVLPENRSVDGECPPLMTQEEYEAVIDRTAEGLQVPNEVDPTEAGALKWAYDEIRRAGGLAIFPHPTWIHDVFHVPDALSDFLVDTEVFDAFEVLGGENYFEQNGFQTVRYYEDKARGKRYPVVGSTDSHNSTPLNRNALICSTIVFAESNECECIKSAIKDFRSVAVDTISKEFRLVGEMRLVRYGCFLLRNYFPLHDEACFEEGRLLKQYFKGTPEESAAALAVLNVMNGRIAKMLNKYFGF